MRWEVGAGGSDDRLAVPLVSELSEAFQFGLEQEGLVVADLLLVQVAHLKPWRQPGVLAGGRHPSQATRCCCSTPIPGSLTVALGGIARRGIHDNMKTAADKAGSGAG
ncbi:MAG: hypothetical protein IPG28_08430 [Betaproteobacteria bacterium]|nr:hypothetical protein [Betaproteobacteria bacterium]